MARQPRFVLPGQAQDIIQRGNNRNIIFCTEEDYRFYLDKLADSAKRFSCDIHAYVLMTNHVHLLVTPHDCDSISKMMQSLGRYYVQYFNYCYKRTGTLWEGRYKASLIDSENYLLICMRYIELNPMRAGMVECPSDYIWSSYRHNAMGVDDALLHEHYLYKSIGISKVLRQKRYRCLFDQSINDDLIENIREATNKAWVLGSDRFKQEITRLLDRRVSPKARGGDRKSSEYRKINRV